MFDPPFPNGSMLCYFTSLYLNQFDDLVIDKMITSFIKRPAKILPFVLQDLSGASMRVSADKTAFGDRSAPYLLELNSAWLDPKESDFNISWTRENMAKFKEFSTGATYLNHSGFNEEGEKLVKRTYGANYERLRQVKKKYDPSNLFRVNQNITPG
ncbi:MAG: BBE domain-containing protein, partial [Thermodesulfobacteriota bacterium]